MGRVLAVSLILAACSACAQASDGYAEARNASRAAYQAGDFEAALAHARDMATHRPGYPPALAAVARTEARLGRAEDALATLIGLAEADVAVDVSGVADFAGVRELPGYARLEMLQSALMAPAGEHSVAARLDDPGFVPEGIAVDAEGRLYLGSIRYGRIVRIGSAGVETFAASGASGLASVFGLRIDEANGLLWAATAMMPQAVDFDPERAGASGILRFRLADGAPVDAHWLPEDGAEHVLGDLIVMDEHLAVATDSAGGAILELDTRTGRFTPLVEPGRLESPQGIAFDPRRDAYFVADWGGGLHRLERASGRLERVEGSPGALLYGIDGLYLHGGDLIAVQNMSQPHRVTRIALDATGHRVVRQDILARALPEFDEPTLGTVDGDTFYLVANSHWNRFGADNRLQDPDSLTGPTVLAIPLGE
ncbi:tetratricopeptide repeat protein [Luteimonas sp. SJ-92]|uniref:Tetratricopeptide repeat protein n=1 Tax=Luteimonas salinisoli TaxID=2752307 RepID=A0A853JDP2_9GAMM|nr:tetratricopeptide repeat protein [Luteimonas salinisoli]NZA27433.1 tetratricopeptide repeat protein [Luteimonas salinisoli]